MNLDTRQRNWLLGALLMVGVILTYQPAWHAGFVWDDDKYVTDNPLLTAPDGLKRIWFSLDAPSQYFPLVYTSFRFERALWGLNPAPYHLVNILFHAVNALLVWRILWVLRVPGSWLGAALFALHPVQVESVAWITERKNMMVGFFSALSMLSWIKYRELDSEHRHGANAGRKEGMKKTSDRKETPPSAQASPPVAEGAEQRRGSFHRFRTSSATAHFYVLSLIFFALALFSKTTACTLPIAFLIIEWWKHKRITAKKIGYILPFLMLAFAMGLVTIWWEQNHQAVKGKLAVSLTDRVLIASRAIWFYLGKLVWPENLSFSYARWKIDATDLIAWVWPALTVLVAVILFRRREGNRGIVVATLFFVITLAPLLGFVMLATFKYTFVADHYQYVACAGPLALAGAGIHTFFQTAGKRQNTIVPIVACGLLLLGLSALSFQQAITYKDPETLWRATVAHSPTSFIAQNNLAALLANRGQVAEAVGHYERAMAEHPDPITAQNLGNAFLALGRVDDAIGAFQQALEWQPDAPSILYSLGNALSARGRIDEAIAAFRRALELQPTGAAIAATLGNALLTKGNVDDAILYFRKAIQLAPTLARAHNGLGNALARKGELAQALAEYSTAVDLQPTNVAALNNLAWLLAAAPGGSVRDGHRAVSVAKRAVELAGGNAPEYLSTLSAAYAESGDFTNAIATVNQALELPASKARAALADSLKSKLKLYESHTPFRDANLGRPTAEAPAPQEPK